MAKAVIDTDILSEIAATATVHGLAIVTGNVDHYARIPDLGFQLTISNWRD